MAICYDKGLSVSLVELLAQDFVQLTLDFYQLDDDAVEVIRPLADQLKPNNFMSGETIVHQGDTADGFYLIIKGTVLVKKTSSFGPLIICRLGPGDTIGINPEQLLDTPIKGWTRSADVICQDDVETLYLQLHGL